MRKRVLQIICSVLAIVMIAGLLSVSFTAEENNLITGKFTYMPSFTDDSATEDFYYSDDYFAAPSSTQNVHLTSMSMALAFAIMEIEGSSYITDLFSKIGFEDLQTNDLDITPTKDTIGTAIAHKKVNGKDLVAVSIRGNKYGAEWASNLIAGAEGNIEGFDSAAEKVIGRIKDYISTHNLENVQLWIAGYSRAGSVADLVGVYVNENLERFSTTADDVFVYCFEAPRCCASDKVYQNIYCVKNKNDLLTYVYPKSWGLYTNGVEIVTGADLTVKTVKIDIMGDDKVIDVSEEDMAEFNSKLIDFIAATLTREKFSGDFDDSVSELIELFFSKSTDEWKAVAAKMDTTTLLAKIMTNSRAVYVLLNEGMAGVMRHNSDKMYQQFTDEMKIVLGELFSADDLGLSEVDYQRILDNLYPLLRAVGPVLVEDYYYNITGDSSTAMPEGYDDPDFDPQTAQLPILTFDQMKSQETPDDFTPEEETDADKGWSDALNDGYDAGHADALAGKERITEAPLPEDADTRSPEYLEAYAGTYLDAYNDGYNNALEELNPKSDEYYEGFEAGGAAAMAAANADVVAGYKASYSETPPAKEDGTPYSEDYLIGYANGFIEGYDNYYQIAAEDAAKLTLYHLGTLFTNISDIITQHYPQTNWALVTAMDPYYHKDILGDVDGDQVVSVLDVTAIQCKLANLPATYNEALADTDGDGSVSILDGTFIQRYLAKLSCPVGIGKEIEATES